MSSIQSGFQRLCIGGIGGAVLLLVVSVAVPSQAAAGDFQVIVNSSNPVSSLNRRAVSRLFLKKERAWSHGDAVTPVDRPTHSSVRLAFSKNLHGKSPTAIKAYWQQQIFSGRGVPPQQLESDRAVIAFVREKRGAIGYVSAEASTSGVTVLKIW